VGQIAAIHRSCRAALLIGSQPSAAGVLYKTSIIKQKWTDLSSFLRAANPIATTPTWQCTWLAISPFCPCQHLLWIPTRPRAHTAPLLGVENLSKAELQ